MLNVFADFYLQIPECFVTVIYMYYIPYISFCIFHLQRTQIYTNQMQTLNLNFLIVLPIDIMILILDGNQEHMKEDSYKKEGTTSDL